MSKAVSITTSCNMVARKLLAMAYFGSSSMEVVPAVESSLACCVPVVV